MYDALVSRQTYPRDRFDGVSAASGRVGAHRAENPRMRAGLVLFWAAIATVVLLVAGIFASMVYTGRIDLTPQTAPSYSDTPEVPAVRDTSYSILVLNGTANPAASTDAVARLEAAGWTADKVIAGAASTTSFATTTVYYSSDADLGAAKGLADLLNAGSIVQSNAYTGASGTPSPGATSASTKQLTIVLGADYQLGTATPAP